MNRNTVGRRKHSVRLLEKVRKESQIASERKKHRARLLENERNEVLDF